MKIAIAVSAAVAVFVLIVAGQIKDHLHTMPPAHVEIPVGGVVLAMQDASGRPVVDVRINGNGPYGFILDTGVANLRCRLPRDSGLSRWPAARCPASRGLRNCAWATPCWAECLPR